MTQEPIAYINVEKRTLEFAKNIFWHTPTIINLERIPLYTQRTWVGLTKKEVHDLYDADYVVFHQRIEAKLKEKNT